MKISVVYAMSDRQIVRELELQEGTTVAAVLRESGLSVEFPIIDAGTSLGIYGRVVSDETVLQCGDRVEIYRPLNAEPKTARRLRSKKR